MVAHRSGLGVLRNMEVRQWRAFEDLTSILTCNTLQEMVVETLLRIHGG